MTVVALHSVSKLYPGARPVTALDDVSLEIEAGDRVAVIGASGSGKSTLLHIIGSLDRPTAGTVELAGKAVERLSDAELAALRGRSIGFVFQQFALLEHLPAVANVAAGLLYRRVGRRERLERAAAALAAVGLADRLHHRPGQLSGGEQQRVAIARAIVGRPLLLLADEPTGNLDSTAGAQVVALIAGLADTGIAVVVVTHDAAVAAAMDRRVAISDGRIVTDASRTPPAPAR